MPLINTENSDCSGVKFEIRSAIPADRETIQQLIAISARELSRGYYSEEQVSAALKSVYGVDSMLIEDGTYFVAEAKHLIIGGGGTMDPIFYDVTGVALEFVPMKKALPTSS